MQKLKITSYTITSALGRGNAANWSKLQNETTGLTRSVFLDADDVPGYIGIIPELDDVRVEGPLKDYDCRNNRLALIALQEDDFRERVESARDRYGSDRIAVYIGTSTSGINQTELAYHARRDNQGPLPAWYQYKTTHNVFSITDYVQKELQLNGIGAAISTACSSSAKVFASAERAIRLGLCDAAVVGGVDTLCLTTLYGFHSLQLVSSDICRPCDRERAGLSIGEAAGFALLEKVDANDRDRYPMLLGYGESSDAFHMSSPRPDGEGAVNAMRAALTGAGADIDEVDYINMHGTGTKANDLAESNAIATVFGTHLPCSSTKGWTGHTLGAAGIVEVVFSLMSLQQQWIPKSLNLNVPDESIKINVRRTAENRKLNAVLSNSFGFGGSNCSLLLGYDLLGNGAS